MIRSAILLARSSLLSVLFLAAALLTLVTVLSDAPEEDTSSGSGLAGALAPMAKPRPPGAESPPALRVALFDPERRPETIAGSIDDLRGLAAPPPPPADVAISGVLLDGHTAKAMLAVTGGSPAWSSVGAEVGGWRVASIDAAGAVLEHDGRSVTLKVADRLRTRGHPAADGGAPPGPQTGDGGPPQGAPADTFVPPDPVDPQKP